MLPAPFSLPSRRPRRWRAYAPLSSQRQGHLKTILLSRARITNLGLVLIAAFFLLLFSWSWVRNGTDCRTVPARFSSISSTIPTHNGVLSHLVMVPGHAIYKGSDAGTRLQEEDWVLESYQKGGGRVATFFQHIKKAADITLADPKALLVFSGGQTRPSSTTTEAESYLRLATLANVFKNSLGGTLFSRATTEEFALDSYQNLLFSVARFHEVTGRYPEQITVVGYGMKGKRFTELHRAALRWPLARFHYIGVDPQVEKDAVTAHEGEKRNGYLPYTRDLYGCHSELLAKRLSRNTFHRFHPYHNSCPELAELLEWCPSDGTSLYDGKLPWVTLGRSY